MQKTINLVKCQSGDMTSIIKTEQPIQFRHDNKLAVTDMETGHIVLLFPSDVKYITPIVVTERNQAQVAVQAKCNYIVQQIAQGPLTDTEEKELIGLLRKASKHESMWGAGIKDTFLTGNQEAIDELVSQLASQCMDDIFTMTCILGQKAVIYLLRTIK